MEWGVHPQVLSLLSPSGEGVSLDADLNEARFFKSSYSNSGIVRSWPLLPLKYQNQREGFFTSQYHMVHMHYLHHMHHLVVQQCTPRPPDISRSWTSSACSFAFLSKPPPCLQIWYSDLISNSEDRVVVSPGRSMPKRKTHGSRGTTGRVVVKVKG